MDKYRSGRIIEKDGWLGWGNGLISKRRLDNLETWVAKCRDMKGISTEEVG
jgi:hypothetical protein